MTLQYIDQLNRTITLPNPPQRIISLVPSQTELLFDLELNDRVVGVTKFCIHPHDAVAAKTKVGGTKKINFNTIRQLKPDLIIGNKEENEQEQIEALMQEYPVWMSDISNLPQSLEMIQAIGSIAQSVQKANQLMAGIDTAFANLHFTSTHRTAYFIWRKPYMVAAGGTFIDDMLLRCGLINVFGKQNRYPQVLASDLQEANPEVILLSSEPYPFKDNHIQELQIICPNAQIMLVDGEMFSWYGSRLLHAPSYFQEVINSLSVNRL